MLKNVFFLSSLFFALNIQNNQRRNGGDPRAQNIVRRLKHAIGQQEFLKQHEIYMKRVGKKHLDTCCYVSAICAGGVLGVGMAAAITSLYLTPNTRQVRQINVRNIGQSRGEF